MQGFALQSWASRWPVNLDFKVFVHHKFSSATNHATFLQEPAMAVQQNKKSPSKRGMHRSHNALNVPGIAVEPTTGEIHLRHHISPNGFYRGRQVLKNKSEA
jgi:large subunit ribosomal protein L32